MRVYASIADSEWLDGRLNMLGNLVIFCATLFAVISRDVVSSGVVGLTLYYATLVTPTLSSIVKSLTNLESEMISVEKIKAFNEIDQEKSENSRKIPKNWPSNGKIEFKDFKLRYNKEKQILHNINFKIEAGEKIAIVGRTGCGKSSLGMSLFRINEMTDGRILIDNNDIFDFDLKSLRSLITAIPQDPILFNDTLRFNLDPLEERSDEEIWKALEKVHIKEKVKEFSEGLSHKLVDGGSFSSGERQLLSLARALVKKSKIIVLDEVTASADVDTEARILVSLKIYFKILLISEYFMGFLNPLKY